MTQDSRLMFAAKGVGAFFGFLLLFFGVSTYLGGGITGIAASIVLAVIAVTVLVLLWPRFREKPAVFPTRTIQPTTPSTSTVPQNNQSSTQLCSPGPYDVVYGDTVKLTLDVKSGNKIEGYVREINNDFFDWFIVDEDEMIRFFDGMRPRPIAGEKNVVVSKVSCQIPHSGPWYLLLDIGSRQNDRQVEVVLRRATK